MDIIIAMVLPVVGYWSEGHDWQSPSVLSHPTGSYPPDEPCKDRHSPAISYPANSKHHLQLLNLKDNIH